MRSQEEHLIQKSIVKYLDWLNINYFAIPNGGARHLMIAKKLKAEGVKRGVADLFIYQASKEYHGLFIEVKTAKGTQSPYQKDFQKLAQLAGYKYELVRSLDETINVLKNYGII